jgi:hypothetical protein
MKTFWRFYAHRLPMGCLSPSILFLAHNSFQPPSDAPVCTIEAKDFIPLAMWTGSKIQYPHLMHFEEGNMENISPTIKIDISVKPNVMEEITLGVTCSLEGNHSI